MDFIKKNWKWLLPVVIVVYTIIVVFLTITIYRNCLAKKVQNVVKNAFSEAFNIDSEKNDNQNEKINEDVSSSILTKGEGKTEVKKTTSIELNDMISNETWEIVLKGTEFTQDVVPPKTSSYYSHYEIDDKSNTYLVTKLDLKNIATTDQRGDDSVSIKAVYDGKYEYNGWGVIVDNDNEGFSRYEDVKPLTTRHEYYLIELPKLIADDDKSVSIQITFGNDVYEYQVK